MFGSAESQPYRITLHVSDVKVASTGAFYLRLPNQPSQKSSSACRIRNSDTTLRYAKVGINFRHGHGEDVAFAMLFCGMLRPDVYYAVMKVSLIYTPHRYTETRCG